MRSSFTAVFMLAMLWSSLVVAADGALVFGLELRDGRVSQTSASTIERLPAARAVHGAAWSLRVIDADGATRFERAVGAPRQHHATGALAFAAIVPTVPAGSQVILADEHGVERWTTRIDSRLLGEARSSAQQIAAATRHAKTTTADAGLPRDGSALARQLAAARSRADMRAMDERNAPPRGAAPVRDTETHRRNAAPAPAPGPLLPISMTPLATPLQTTSSAPSAAKVAVAARIVKEGGDAPGVSFQSWLLDASGNPISAVPVPASGEITLDLPSNGNYILDIRPPPPLLSRRATFAYTGAALADFVIGSGWIYEVIAQDAATGTVLTTAPSAWLYPPTGDPIAGYVAAGRARFAVPKTPAVPYTAYVYGFGSHPGVVESLPPFSADRTDTLSLPATAMLPVQVRGPDGTPVRNAQVQCEGNGPTATRHYFAIVNTGINAAAGMPLPRDLRYNCFVDAAPPLFSQWFVNIAPPAADTMVFNLQRAAVLEVALVDNAGAAFTGEFVGEWVDYTLGLRYACDTNPCRLPVPTTTPVTVTFDFAEDRYRDTSIGPETFAADTRRTLTVQTQHAVTGTVTGAGGAAAGALVVARTAAGDFVSSIRTDDDGSYALPLLDGNYTLHAYATPNVLASVGAGESAYEAPAASGVLQIAADTVVPPLALPGGRGTLTLRARMPCAPLDVPNAAAAYRGVLHLAGPDGRHIERIWRQNGTPTPVSGSSDCQFQFTTTASAGTYAAAVTLPGWAERSLGNVTLTDGGEQSIDASFTLADRQGLWQPQLRYADGSPAAGVNAILYDETQRGVIQFFSDVNGRLAMPSTPGWGVELFLPAAAPGTSVRRSFVFDGTPPAVVTLDRVAAETTPDGGLQRVFGNGERDRRYNILFVAEGYTNARETFTDSNGNGVWDGVVWVDVNGNGVFDSGVDWFATYGNAAAPTAGSTPGAGNEAFVDSNGDGVLSLDDRALFLANTHVFMRSLLGSDYWSEHRDMFNAYALFAPSAQAGYDLIDEDQETVLLDRDTRYNAGVELERDTIVLDRDTAIQHALSALPEVDVVIVLVNQPVRAGRANVSFGGAGPGVMVYYGGVQETSPNGIVQSHEMGHFVGQLCDEYDEFPGLHPQHGSAGPGCANSSYRHAREHLPWGDLIAAGTPLPTLDVNGATSAVIGSSTYNDGAYRPTLNSTMRYNSPFFNEPSRRALASATCARTEGRLGCGTAIDDELRTATWWDPAEAGWGLFTIDQGNILAPGWFTYDDDGEPTWFLVPGALPQADGSYKGEILRYTGVPFPQIAGNAANPPTPVGDATLVFERRDRLRFTYAMDGGATRTRTLSRFVYGDRDIVCRATSGPLEQATQYSDLWWSPATSGWGLFIAHVGDTLFATWYTYDLDGEAVFMIGSATRQPDGSYSGPLVRQRDGTPYASIDGAPPSTGADAVGTVELRFDNGNAGSFRYTVGATTGTHAITRLLFGDTAGVCSAEPVQPVAAMD